MESKGPLPNFVVIGAARAGTTSIHRYLKQHPEVCTSHWKETDFFAFWGEDPAFTGPGDGRSINATAVTDLEEYRRQFEHWDGEKAIGEASPNYLYVPRAPRNLAEVSPDVQLILSLRDPTDRAYSDFLNMVKLGFETTKSFKQAIEVEVSRIQDGWGPYYHYVSKGFYAQQVSRFLEHFSEDQLHVLKFGDLKDDPVREMQGIYSFLGIDDGFSPDTSVAHNASGIPGSRRLHELITGDGVIRWLREHLIPDVVERKVTNFYTDRFLERPELEPVIRRRLSRVYADDLEELQTILDIDVSSWSTWKLAREHTDGGSGLEDPSPYPTGDTASRGGA